MVRASVGAMRADSCELRIDVTDTGIGIDRDQMPALFEPFRQGDSGMARRFGGTGLGLAIVKRLVKLLGGSVAVQSTIDAGSTFTVILPCTIIASPLARPAAMPRDPEHGTHPRASILIAEDNDINRELVTQMLARLGHEGRHRQQRPGGADGRPGARVRPDPDGHPDARNGRRQRGRGDPRPAGRAWRRADRRRHRQCDGRRPRTLSGGGLRRLSGQAAASRPVAGGDRALDRQTA